MQQGGLLLDFSSLNSCVVNEADNTAVLQPGITTKQVITLERQGS